MSESKTVVITGGERGIGRSIAEKFLSQGWRVAILGKDVESADQFLEEVKDDERMRFFEADVSSFIEVDRSMAAIEGWFGRIDALIANAGIASPQRHSLDDYSIEEWNRVIAVNLSGVFHSAKSAAKSMKGSGGSIVTIASTRAAMSEPDTFAYSASKGGVVTLTHSLAASLGPAIRVNCVSPGWIHCGEESELSKSDKSQHWVGRVGTPADIAGLSYFLCSEEAGFVTGQEFVVDGGMTKKMIYV